MRLLASLGLTLLGSAVLLGCSSSGSQPEDPLDGGTADAPSTAETDGRPAIDAPTSPPFDGAEVDDCDPDGPNHPGADEVLGDGVDNDCDGLVDELTVCATGGSHATIAAAVADVPAGGLILVCAGTYHERITTPARSFELRGAGAATTILDADDGGTAISVLDAPSPGVTVRGFTIQNGQSATQGGAVYCRASSLHVLDGTITTSSATSGGGGLYASGCTLEIANVLFSQNGGGATGGGALLESSTGELRTSIFTGNLAANGGGLSLTEGGVAVLDSEFRANMGITRGGGIYTASDSLIAGNVVADNRAGWTGGGIHVVGHAPMIRNNTVHHNTSTNDGGGFYLDQSTATLLGNVVTENDGGDDGGGIRVFESRARIEGNRIERNHAGDGGGGIRVSHVPTELIDNLVRDNVAENTGGGMDLDNDASLVRGGEITGNQASSGGGIFHWLGPWTGLHLEDVRIADNDAWRGGGVFLDDNFKPVVLKNVIIEDNTANYGAGLMVRATDLVITSSLFRNNQAATRGGAIYAGVPSQTSGWDQPCPPCPPTDPTVTIGFTTFHGNQAAHGSAVWTDAPHTVVYGSILADNTAPQVKVEAPVATPGVVPTPSWRYNDVMPPSFDGMADPTGREGNLGVLPGFLDPVAGDFHLAPGSQCIDAADPTLRDVDGTRADMGMFGGGL